MSEQLQNKKPERIRHGGLMRCCLATLDELRGDPPEPAKEADTLNCKYCHASMRFHDGAWEWAR